MKRTLASLTGVVMGLALLAPSGALAFGLGAYVEGAAGSVDWTFEDEFGRDFDVDGDEKRGTFGFVLDTAVAKDTLFNYRLSVGFSRFDADFDDVGETLELSGLVVDNTFGFGVYRSESLRLWLGPQVRLAFYTGEFEDSGFEVDVIEFALAPVVGLNLHLGRTMSLAFAAGYRFSGYAGSDEDDDDITGRGREVFGNLSLLFRLSDDRWK
jgi:hypothetical protein